MSLLDKGTESAPEESSRRTDIIDLIHLGLRKANEKQSYKHRIKKNFSPTNADTCAKKLFYEFKGFPKEPYDDSTLKIFALGNAIHRLIQETIPNQLCAEFRIEQTWHNDLPLSGYVDSIILTKDGVCVTDYKSIKNAGLPFVSRAPKESNAKQLMVYCDVLNIHDGRLLYFGKSDGEMVEHKVEFDQKVIDEIVKHFTYVRKCVQENRIPPKCGADKRWQCGWCSYAHYCAEGIKDISEIKNGPV